MQYECFPRVPLLLRQGQTSFLVVIFSHCGYQLWLLDFFFSSGRIETFWSKKNMELLPLSLLLTYSIFPLYLTVLSERDVWCKPSKWGQLSIHSFRHLVLRKIINSLCYLEGSRYLGMAQISLHLLVIELWSLLWLECVSSTLLLFCQSLQSLVL